MMAIGYRTGELADPARLNWDGTGARPITWSAWYPTEGAGIQAVPCEAVFDTGNIQYDAPVADGDPFPVVLLSHGTGGTAASLGWLGRALAETGWVVLAANHHGNTECEPYRAEGFLCWWERASDLSFLLSAVSEQKAFAGRLDESRVSVAGFSLGAHTALTLVGGRSSVAAFDTWRVTEALESSGPREFPDLVNYIPRLQQSSEVFRASWARQDADLRDPRIRAVASIAPAPPVRAFRSDNVAEIAVPVTLITGGADLEAPAKHGADWLCALNPSFRRHDLGTHVGHYTFIDVPADPSLTGQVDIFTDHPSIDRRAIHRQAAALVRAALA